MAWREAASSQSWGAGRRAALLCLQGNELVPQPGAVGMLGSTAVCGGEGRGSLSKAVRLRSTFLHKTLQWWLLSPVRVCSTGITLSSS